MAACLAFSAKTLSVSAFASATASSAKRPGPRCGGAADSDAVAAGADDEEAAVDAFAVGPSDCGGPFGDGPMCVCGSVRAGRGVCVRFGPCAGCC